LYQFNSRRRN